MPLLPYYTGNTLAPRRRHITSQDNHVDTTWWMFILLKMKAGSHTTLLVGIHSIYPSTAAGDADAGNISFYSGVTRASPNKAYCKCQLFEILAFFPPSASSWTKIIIMITRRSVIRFDVHVILSSCLLKTYLHRETTPITKKLL